jgi:hypothetical protein
MSESGQGFGPSGPAAGEAAPFVVGGPSQLNLDASRSGRVSFTVSNVTGRPVRARLNVRAGAGADASWFQIQPEVGQPPQPSPSATAERALPVAGTATVDVTLRVPDQAPAGPATFSLGAALEEAPNQVVSGPTVAFQVPPPAAKRKFPWWIVIVAAAVLLVGGGILIWILTRPDPAPTTVVTATATPVAETLIVSVEGIEVLDGAGSVLDAAEFDDGAAVLEVLSATLGETPDPTSNPNLSTKTYDWRQIAITVVDGGPATMWIFSDEIAGIDVHTEEGIGIGSSKQEAIDAGAMPQAFPDQLRFQIREVPGTTSLETSGIGVKFIWLLLTGEQVTRMIVPSNDYSDL